MDIVSNALWANALFNERKWVKEAVIFSLVPDIGYLIIVLYILFATPRGVPYALSYVPPTAEVPYFMLHSFVFLAVVALLFYKFKREMLPALSGWALHIIIDIPTHDEPLLTQFLYPVSDFGIQGTTWLNVWVLLINYCALGVVYSILLVKQILKKPKAKGLEMHEVLREKEVMGSSVREKK